MFNVHIGVIHKDFVWNTRVDDDLSNLSILLVLQKDGSLDDSITNVGEPLNLSTADSQATKLPTTPPRQRLRIKDTGQGAHTQEQIMGILTSASSNENN